MNSLIKGSLLGTVLTICAFTVQAQKISDQDLKVNVAEISNPVSQLKALEPISFNYNPDQQKHLKLPSGSQFGFATTSLSANFQSVVVETSKQYPAGKNQFKTAKYDEVKMESLIPVLVAAINEQQAQIDALKNEIEALKKK
ncbi:tail fiber domain-containing protein [Daejeonella oryzae]|uniref:tail fiber domain-containing protein n=1 Tax=Daejeonella oryzae TaxID=1122943 RepID=UPI000422BDBC|nr:tail fiber domain-containing protein [Daejeonella oryzae]